MSETRAQTLHRESWRALAGATARALSGDKSLHVRGNFFYRDETRLNCTAPHLYFETRDAATAHGVRAQGDAVALRVRHSDPALHDAGRPTSPIEKRVFDLLEQLRVESLVAPYMHGQARNLDTHFLRWSQAFHHAGLTETGVGLLVFTVTQICWSRLTTHPVPEDIDGLIESTRVNLAPTIGVSLSGLREHRFDQRRYARDALQIANAIGELVRDEAGVREGAPERDVASRLLAALALFGEMDLENAEEGTASSGHASPHSVNTQAYRVYTRQYDKLSDARTLARPAELKHYRAELDQQVADAGIHTGHLARQLRRLLCTTEARGFEGGHEEGLIDSASLAQFIASPGVKTIFRQPRREPIANCLVTLLIDCSGSMKAHLPQLAVLADSLTRALDRIGVSSELLGFSTLAWHGGRARLDWARAGKHATPGRLNETHHIVFKAEDEAWRHARPAIASLLKTDWCREGIDGEALAWACTRMRASKAVRRILVFISDGCPMDGATQQANGEAYLDSHLRQVVAQHDHAIELCGLGIGQDLSRYFRRSMGIDLTEAMDGRVLSTVVGGLLRQS